MVIIVALLIIASSGSSWNHTLGSVRGCKYMGTAIGPPPGGGGGVQRGMNPEVLAQVCPQGGVQL